MIGLKSAPTLTEKSKQSMTPSLLTQAIMFRQAMKQPIGSPDEIVHEFQFGLIREEYGEFDEAFSGEFDGKISLEDQLKELADLVFVCYQYAAARGWNLDAAMHRVFHSNMSKLVDGKPLRRDDGKIMKGPNYEPPILEDLL
jgi:NTP pyrophosphatase (non-canonical NTP hydrolase)